MRWFLLALRLALPVTIPAALVGTHLTMHDFLLPILGVAVMRMRWFLLALRLALPVTIPAALVGTPLTMHGEVGPHKCCWYGDWKRKSKCEKKPSHPHNCYSKDWKKEIMHGEVGP